MVITEEVISSFTNNGGMPNKQQCKTLGIFFPPKSGWKKRIIGTEISSEEYDELIFFKAKPKLGKRVLTTSEISNIKARFNESVLTKLKQEGLDTIVMGDRFRVNGCVDMYHDSFKIFDLVKKEVTHFDNIESQLSYCVNLSNHYGLKKAFNSNTNGVPIREFMYRKKGKRIVAPYYHWINNISKKGEDHLYFIKCQFSVKIGRTKDVESRLKSLITGMPSKHDILFVAKNKGFMESKMHNIFNHLKTNGGGTEWFKYTSEISDFILFLERGGYVKSMYDINSIDFPQNVIEYVP